MTNLINYIITLINTGFSGSSTGSKKQPISSESVFSGGLKPCLLRLKLRNSFSFAASSSSLRSRSFSFSILFY